MDVDKYLQMFKWGMRERGGSLRVSMDVIHPYGLDVTFNFMSFHFNKCLRHLDILNS